MDRNVILKDGRVMPGLGMGTWYMGDSPARAAEEIEALKSGIDAGITLIDTAEMYGSGRSERLIGKAIKGCRREELFLVSKVLPNNAGCRHIFTSLDNTLERLGTDYLDLYLLHWRGGVPLRETVECMEELTAGGKIRGWGVSNLDREDMEELFRIPGGEHCLVNQVLYHLGSRGIEYDLLPWMEEHGVACMAYCPLAQAGTLRRGLADSGAVKRVAEKHGVTPLQILLSFTLLRENVIPIPKSGKREHVLENAAALEITLDEEDKERLNRAFPAPDHPTYLDIV